MKKKVLALAALAIAASIGASGTLAYYTAQGKAHNVITTGSVGIKIIEKMKDGSDFPADGIDGVVPGTAVSKIVTVENTGEADAWIRVELESAIVDEDGNELSLTVGEEQVPVMTYEIKSGWIDGQDGYYYYKKPVAPGDSTTALIEEVKYSIEMGNDYQECITSVTVSAQAVQVANNPIPDGGDVTDIKGWPEK